MKSKMQLKNASKDKHKFETKEKQILKSQKQLNSQRL